MNNTAIVYSIGTEGSVKIVGTKAAAMTSPADFFGKYSVTLWVNVELNEDGKMKDGTIVAAAKSFKREGGAIRFSNRHLGVK